MQGRLHHADVLRVGATITVVVLHTATPVLQQFTPTDHTWWWTANVVDSCCRWSIPVFFMISGMLLLDASKSEPATSFFRKRFNKVAVPFIAWSVIYSFWNIKYQDVSYSIPTFAKQFLTGDVYYHLWYFYPLIGLYILTPILRSYLKGSSTKSLTSCFLLIWIVAAPFYALLNNSPALAIERPAYLATLVVASAGYFLIGHLLNKEDISKGMRRLLYVTAPLALLATAFGTYFFAERNGSLFRGYFYNYFSINVIIMSVAIFVLSRLRWSGNHDSGPMGSGFLHQFSRASLGIYLIHPMILTILSRVDVNAMFIHPILGIPITGVAVVAISFGCVTVLQKIPVIRRIVP